ncbi:MAG TPA: type I pantothenate kinase, partial [Acidimicrobiales bacterium]
DRFRKLVEEAEDDPTSFFAQWSELPPGEVLALAATVWETVNLANLFDHILPTRWRADLILHKGADHAVSSVAVRAR